MLGPLEVLERESAVPVGGLKQRTLLAILLLHANEAVSEEALIDALWHGERPETAHNTLQAHVSRLRRALGRSRIDSQAPGYLLHLEPMELDVQRFERLASEGRRALADGDSSAAAVKLREALALWRGAPLAEFTDESFAQPEIRRLQEEKLATIEDRLEADLADGRHADLVGELERLIADHPYRERLRGQLMLALYRCGRQAEALELYRSTRSALVGQLGIEPSPALQRLETAILLQDPALELAAEPPVPHPPAPREPVQKPVTVLAATSVPAGAAQRVESLLAEHEAAVESSDAGEVVGVFGVPSVREDDTLRAARAALRLSHAEPRLRIALESGKVVEASGRPLADTLMQAARTLARRAGAGEVVVGPFARGLLPARARFERRDGDDSGFRLTELAPKRTTGRPLTAPLVGRRIELGQLLQAFESTRARRTSHLVTVLGAPGIGKTRLGEELEAKLADDALIVGGRCPAYGEGTAFSPLGEIFRHVGGDGTPAALMPLLEGDGQARLVASRLAGAFGSGGAPGEVEDTLWAFRRLLEALARARPSVVCFEDAHWADETLLDFVEHVVEWSREVPLLVLCLARPELLDTRPGWGGGKLNAVTISLEPMTDDESAELMEFLGDTELPEERRRRIRDVAEGNPLFLEQILALARDQRWQGELTIPPTIEAILAARLDRLEPAERRVLECAAVVGREFWVSAVEELSVPAERSGVLAALRRLVRKDLVVPGRSLLAGEDSFRFRHLLIRDVAYDFIPKPLRADFHERLGDWLEEADVDLGEDADAVIGYHLEQAYRGRQETGALTGSDEQLARRAAERLAAAHRSEVSKGGLRARVNLLERAVSLVEYGANDKAVLLSEIGSDLEELGDRDGAVAYFLRSERIALEHGDVALELLIRGRVLRHRLRFYGDLELPTFIEAVSDIVEALDNLGAGEYAAKGRAMLASAHLSHGQTAEAERFLRELKAYSTNAANMRLLNMSQRLLIAAWLWGPTRVDLAIARCMDLLNVEPPLRLAASAYGALAILVSMEGDFDQGRAYARLDREILEELGFASAAAGIRFFEGYVEILAGDPRAAEAALRPGLEKLVELKDTLYASGVAALTARAVYLQGRREAAWELLDVCESFGKVDVSSSIAARALRGRLLVDRGEVKTGIKMVRSSIALAMETDQVVDQADALADLSHALADSGDPNGARDAAERSLMLSDQKGNVIGVRTASALLH